jgi:hypothetical protein
MDQPNAFALIGAAAVGLVALLLILRRLRKQDEDANRESPFATSTEGEKRCPSCGMGNMWTDARCVSCGAKLPG